MLSVWAYALSRAARLLRGEAEVSRQDANKGVTRFGEKEHEMADMLTVLQGSSKEAASAGPNHTQQ